MAKEKPNFMQYASIPANRKNLSDDNKLEKNNDNDDVINIDDREDAKTFVIGKKQITKSAKKGFPIYLKNEQFEKIEAIEKRTGYSRNEVICQMIDFCLENMKYDFETKKQ